MRASGARQWRVAAGALLAATAVPVLALPEDGLEIRIIVQANQEVPDYQLQMRAWANTPAFEADAEPTDFIESNLFYATEFQSKGLSILADGRVFLLFEYDVPGTTTDWLLARWDSLADFDNRSVFPPAAYTPYDVPDDYDAAGLHIFEDGRVAVLAQGPASNPELSILYWSSVEAFATAAAPDSTLRSGFGFSSNFQARGLHLFEGGEVAVLLEFQGAGEPRDLVLAFWDSLERFESGIGLPRYVAGGPNLADAWDAGGLWFAPRAVVPEPATWAILIVGFGVVGAGLRRRRALAA